MSVIGLRIFASAIDWLACRLANPCWLCRGRSAPAGSIFDIGMQDNDDIAPAGAAVACQQNAPVGDGVDRIAQIAVFAADSVQIVAEVMVFREPLGAVAHRSVFAAERKIKTPGRRNGL